MLLGVMPRRAAEATENDGLHWSQSDGLVWPHLHRVGVCGEGSSPPGPGGPRAGGEGAAAGPVVAVAPTGTDPGPAAIWITAMTPPDRMPRGSWASDARGVGAVPSRVGDESASSRIRSR